MTSGGPKSPDLLWDLDEVMDVIGEGFTIIHAKVETVQLDESDLHRGDAHVVRLHLLKEVSHTKVETDAFKKNKQVASIEELKSAPKTKGLIVPNITLTYAKKKQF